MARTPREVAIEWAMSLKAGDLDRLVALHHERLVCSLLGSTLVSGRYRGRDAFFAHTIKNVMGSMAETDEVYLKGFRIACADSQYSVMQLHGGLPTKSGGRYDQNYLQLFKVEEGLITETHELLDTVMLDTQVFGKKLTIARTAPEDSLTPATKFTGMLTPATLEDVVRVERSFGLAAQSADLQAFTALLHPDAVLQIAGSTPLSGTVRGREQVLTMFAQYVLRYFLPGSLHIDGEARHACRDENGFCWFANVQGTLKNGDAYRQIVGVVARVHATSIVDLHIYFDTAEEERQTFANPLTGGTSETAPERFTIYSALTAPSTTADH